MTREEQINQAAWKYDKENPSTCSEDYKVEGFIAGAEWADSHPNWHDYEIDRNFPKEVILHTTEGTFSAEYNDHLNQFFSGNGWIDESTIIAWMEKPQAPKFD